MKMIHFFIGGWLDKCNNISNIEFICEIEEILDRQKEMKSTTQINQWEVSMFHE